MDHPGGGGSGRAIQSRNRLLTLSHNSSYTGEDEDGASDGEECKGAQELVPAWCPNFDSVARTLCGTPSFRLRALCCP